MGKMLTAICESIYVDKDKEMIKLRSRARVLGYNKERFNFLIGRVDYIYKLVYNYQLACLKGNGKMKERIEGVFSRINSPTYEILANNYSDSIIPELFAELGPDMTMKFVRIFSGQEVKVPQYRDFCDDLMSGTVLSLSGGSKDKLYQLSVDYGISYRALSRIFDRAKKSLEYKCE